MIKRLLFIAVLLIYPLKIYANPVTAMTEMGIDIIYEEGSIIDWALLYEGAGYKHDLYLNFNDNTSLHLATNARGTGSLSGCGHCSYLGLWGTEAFDENIEPVSFGLQINDSSTYFYTGDASVNPDNLVHSWIANHAGFNDYIDLTNPSRSDREHTNIEAITTHYMDNNFNEIVDIIADQRTYFVGFEDILRGGDRDYNDLIFAYRFRSEIMTATVSEPHNLLLMGLSLIGIGLLIRRRNKAAT